MRTGRIASLPFLHAGGRPGKQSVARSSTTRAPTAATHQASGHIGSQASPGHGQAARRSEAMNSDVI
jgi:hypothetical protein